MSRMRVFGVLMGLVPAMAPGQTSIDLRTQSKSIDFSAAASTRPAKTGTALPGTCAVGDLFFRSDAAPGSNLYGCSSTNTWAQLAGASVANWGTITGTLGNQSDLQSALDGKQPSDPDLSAIAALACPDGQILKRAAGVWICGADAVGGAGVGAYAASTSSATTWSVPGATHGLGTCDLVAGTYASSGSTFTQITPSALACNSSSFDVTITWAAPQSGRVVLVKGGGGSGGGDTVTAGTGVVVAGGATKAVAVDTAVVPTFLSGTGSLDFANITNGSCAELTFAMAGAATGDAVAAGWPSTYPAGLSGIMFVSSTNTITVRACNHSGAGVDPANLAYRATIVRSF